MKKLSLSAFLLLCFFSKASLAQECDFEIFMTNATISPTSSMQVLPHSYTVRRDKNKDSECSRYRLFFSKGLANSYQRKAFNNQNDPYNYNLHQNINMNGILKERNDALNAAEYVEGNSPNRRTDYQGNFFVSIPALSSQTNQRAGVYQDNVTVSLFRVEDNNSIGFELSQAFQVNINIPVALNVSLVNEGDPFNINATTKILDFGNLEVNQELRADMIVNTNTPYQLRVSSFNNGKMLKATSGIDYSMQVNSTSVALGSSRNSPVTVATGAGPSSVVGDRYNIKIKILNIPAVPSPGIYEDAITITAIAN